MKCEKLLVIFERTVYVKFYLINFIFCKYKLNLNLKSNTFEKSAKK